MRNSEGLEVRLVALNLFIAWTYACSQPLNWRPYSMEEQLYRFDIVVTGSDMRHVVQRNSTEGVIIDSEFEVSCILKGDNQVVNQNITIKDINLMDPCTHIETKVGEMNILGLIRSGSDYKWQWENIQTPVFAYTDDNLRRAVTVCGLQNPRPPANTPSASMTSCPVVESPDSCTAGVRDNVAQNWLVVFSLALILVSLSSAN